MPIAVNNETILVNPKNIKANSTFKDVIAPIILGIIVIGLICFLIISLVKKQNKKKEKIDKNE